MSEFLDTSNNKKTGLFRDVIIEKDYDPLSVHEHCIRVPTGAGIQLHALYAVCFVCGPGSGENAVTTRVTSNKKAGLFCEYVTIEEDYDLCISLPTGVCVCACVCVYVCTRVHTYVRVYAAHQDARSFGGRHTDRPTENNGH